MGFYPIATKYYIPPVHQNHVVRERLLNRLKESEGTRLILVTAPAGFGKTTLVSYWAMQNSTRKVAWLSLDENENSVLQFVLYLIGAIQNVESTFARELQIGLVASEYLDVKTIVKELIDQFVALDDGLRIVLDDFHLVDDLQVMALMNILIEYLPPEVQFIIISRKNSALDLPRWRARGWIHEIDANPLRFTLEESETFLSQMMRLSGVSGIGEELHRRTEGWAAGLHLAAYSMRNAEKGDVALLDTFGGATQYISDYLMAEVFSQQSPRIQDFLLKVSVVGTFNASLSSAIVGIEEDEAASILAELGQSDVLVSSIDHQGHWYRYHKMFQEFLAGQRSHILDSDSIQQLHRNAGNWYGVENLIVNAVEYSLLAKAYEQAAHWIEQISFNDIWRQPLSGRFLLWVPQFPENELRKYPQVVLRALGSFVIRNEADNFHTLLSLIEDDATVINEYKLFKGFLLRFSAKQNEAIAMFSEIYEGTSRDDLYNHFALHQIAISQIEKGGLLAADELVSAFYEERVRHPITQPTPWVHIIYLFSLLKYYQGNLSGAEKILKNGFEQLEKINFQTPLVGLLHNGLGQIYFGRNELNKAETAYTEALRWGELSGIADIQNGAHLGLFHIKLANNDPAAENHLLASQYVIHRGDSANQYEERYAALAALMDLKLGKMDSAFNWAESFTFSSVDRADFGILGQLFIYSMIRLRQAEATKKLQGLDDLLAVIETILEKTQETRQVASHLNFLLARALLLGLQGKKAKAIHTFHQALGLLKSTHLMRAFLSWDKSLYVFLMDAHIDPVYREEVRRILLAFSREPGWQGATSRPAGGEIVSLTRRELEVLSFIAAGLSNKDIQNKLVISQNTLRSHIRNLYRKLDVNSRTQAMKAGQELGLL